MKQILQSLKTGEIELAEIPVPMVKSGHLLIKTVRTLISLGTERMLLNFGKAGWIDKARQQPDKVKQVMQKMKTDGVKATLDAVYKKLDQPLPLGYSNSGIVIAVGNGVTGFKVGDRVLSNGNHAEVVCVPQHLCAKIPDNVSFESASFTVVSAIALEGIRLINPTLGESVAVIGLGLIGLLACQILKANGCRVIGFDFDKHKVELAKTYGVEGFAINESVDPVELAMNFSKQNGVDAVLITAATTSNSPAHQAPQMCRKRGRVVLVGVIGLELSRDDFYKKEISFQVSCSYGPGRYETAYEKKGLDYPIGFVRWTEQRNFEAILQLMKEKKLVTDLLISKEIELDKAKEAYELVSKSTNSLGILLKYKGELDVDKREIKLNSYKIEPAKPIIGFIGAGNFASGTLIPAFEKAGAILKTIASAGGVSGTHVGKKHNFAISTTNASRIFNDSEINTVVITTQHNTHAKFVLEAIKAGKNVFVEKPLCMTPSELEEIKKAYLEANKTKPLLLMVGFNRRFAPLIQQTKEVLETSNAPFSMILTVNAGSIPPEHWTQDISSGGGRIIGEACHFIDLLRFIANSPIKQISAIEMPDGADKPIDTMTINMSFENSSIGTVHYFSNGNKSFPKERLEIFSGGKIIQLDNFKTLNGFGIKGMKKQSLWAQDKGHQNCAKAFVDSISSGGLAPIQIEEIFEITKNTFAVANIK